MEPASWRPSLSLQSFKGCLKIEFNSQVKDTKDLFFLNNVYFFQKFSFGKRWSLCAKSVYCDSQGCSIADHDAHSTHFQSMPITSSVHVRCACLCQLF